jgi:hypothetical protein
MKWRTASLKRGGRGGEGAGMCSYRGWHLSQLQLPFLSCPADITDIISRNALSSSAHEANIIIADSSFSFTLAYPPFFSNVE